MNVRPTPPKVVTLGSPVRVVGAESFSVAEVSYDPGAHYAPHVHDRPYVALGLSGRYREEVDGHIDVAESATVVLLPAGLAHSDAIADRGARAMVITFLDHQIPDWRVLQGGPAAKILIRLYRAFRLSGVAEIDTMHELLLEFFDEFVTQRAAPNAAPAARMAMQILRNRAGEQIRITDIAQRVGVDCAYLARAFRRAHGETMGETLRRVRAKRAASLLASTPMPLAEVAWTAGFADQSHFCRVFLSQSGMTPLAYRRLFRG